MVGDCDDAVSVLLKQVVGASETYLKEIADFRHSLAARPRSARDLIAAMAPLSSIISGTGQSGRAGRKHEQGTLKAASEAFRSLFQAGRYSPDPGMDRKNACRVALDAMVNSPSPVLRKISSRPLCYAIRPEFERARREMVERPAKRLSDAAETVNFRGWLAS